MEYYGTLTLHGKTYDIKEADYELEKVHGSTFNEVWTIQTKCGQRFKVTCLEHQRSDYLTNRKPEPGTYNVC